MEVRTFRAKSLQQALERVWQELGPDTTLLQMRELPTAWWERLARGRQFEFRTRPAEPATTSDLPIAPRRAARPPEPLAATGTPDTLDIPRVQLQDVRQTWRDDLRRGHSPLLGSDSAATSLSARGEEEPHASWFALLTELLDAEIPEPEARRLLELARRQAVAAALQTPDALRQCLAAAVAAELPACRPITAAPGQRRVVALVGPTGVGKTTTIAKLAANFRLRERLEVGLITVDTYRIAAVDQLRTYADIIDLPMEVVATPRAMRDALARLAGMDLVLIDTAGRSPQDAVQLQELKSMLQEARPDEVHLVLSAVAATSHLQRIVARFGEIGATAMLVTKLDEASGLGNLLPVVRSAGLSLSYLTCGQSVPDDIVDADKDKLVRAMLGWEPLASLS